MSKNPICCALAVTLHLLCYSALGQDTNTNQAMALLRKAPLLRGEWYHCDDLARAVNSLRHPGKEKALEVLKRFLDDDDPKQDPAQAEKLFIVCRLLFANPEGWKLPRLGHGEPSVNLKVTERFPLFPLAVAEGVPFLLVRGYAMGGYTDDTPRKCLQLCEQLSLVTADIPSGPCEAAAKRLLESSAFQELYEDPQGKKEATRMILDQALPMDQ